MIIQTLTTSFKKELLQGVHNFASDTFKLALYTSAASLGADTTAYSPAGEVTSTPTLTPVSSHTYGLNLSYEGYTSSYLSYIGGPLGPEIPEAEVGNYVVGNFIPSGTTVINKGYNSLDEVWYLIISNPVTTLDLITETVTFLTPVYSYTAGGNTLVVSGPSSDGIAAYVNFENSVWNNTSFYTAGGLIYNASKSNASVAVLNFGNNKTASGTFTVQFPASTSSTAIIRIT